MNSESIEVEHWSGAGNRFVLVDNREQKVRSFSKELVRRLCRRENFLDAEGLLVFTDFDQPSRQFFYEFYNPDGSSGMMCGNGARCAIRYGILRNQIAINEVQLIFNGRSYKGELIEPDLVRLHLPAPNEIQMNNDWTYVHVGSEHIVIDAAQFIDTLEQFQQFQLERFAENKLDFYRLETGRKALNLNLAFFDESNQLIHLRTYENGVFQETQACGTGAISTSIAFWKRNIVQQERIRCLPISKRMLVVDMKVNDQGETIQEIILQGDARQDISSTEFSLKSMEYRSN